MDEDENTCPGCGNADIQAYYTEEFEVEEGTAARSRMYCFTCGWWWWSETWLAWERPEEEPLERDWYDDGQIYGDYSGYPPYPI